MMIIPHLYSNLVRQKSFCELACRASFTGQPLTSSSGKLESIVRQVIIIIIIKGMDHQKTSTIIFLEYANSLPLYCLEQCPKISGKS